ncbi:MAG: cysteine--1-D-myo-inosityl 2-amino-2-deoxy-alpha-D-glucopyranoside ligase, partial [Mycobacteriales bacterium]
MESWSVAAPVRLPGDGVPLRLWDTATSELRPLAPGAEARMYVCGITPYDATHLGHAMTYLTYDLVQRALLDCGVQVRYVQNVTDIDDDILRRALERGTDWYTLGRREITLFRADVAALNILPPSDYVGAVESMPEIVSFIGRLRAAGATYDVDGDVYFSVATAPHFGAVANRSVAEMLALSGEHGGDPEREGKKDPLDPLLWRGARPGEPSWEAPWGAGRPGWHVECSAIALSRLGTTFDVNGGGADLAFPHHEMSAAHTEVATGTWPVARAFVHTGLVGLDGTKMSKSLGNLVFVRDLRAKREPAAIRLALLGHHYRTTWSWTDADLTAAEERLTRWRAAVARPGGPPVDNLLDSLRRQL